jgi:hypothetical protein
VAFPGQVVGTTSNNPVTVTIINNGNAPLLITNIAITGDFTQTNNCPPSLVSTCFITVKFSPKATGLRSGILTITDNGLNSPQQISVTGTGIDFTFAPGGASQTTVIAGQTATFNLNATAGSGFSGFLSFDCTGAPALATCSVNPPSVSVIGAVPVPIVVTVKTTPHATAFNLAPQRKLWGLGLLAAVLMMSLMASTRQGSSARPRVVRICSAAFLAIIMASCGGGGGGSGTPGPTPTPTPSATGGTPAGTYTLTVTATDQTVNGSAPHQVPLTLVVQ